MYEEHFGLTRKPFQLSPDAEFFFPSAEHRRALSFLQYGLMQGDGFIVITGNVGTGKTTLVHAMLAEQDDSDLSIATIVTSNLSENDLLQLVAHNFDLPTGDGNKATLLGHLEDFFVDEAQAGRRILLVVDEAQNLPAESVEELRMLSNFQLDGKPLVQIFLLGQQEFRTTVLSEGFEQLRQRIIATYHLNPLNDAETKTYIEHRLSIAGWQDSPTFTDEAYGGIFSFTEGVPRRINNLCDRLLLYAFLEEIETIDRDVVEVVSNEIGAEFWGGMPERSEIDDHLESESPAEVFDSPDMPLETVARTMFDKANVQNRLTTLERAVDGLGHNLKPEIAQIREEIGFLRVMMDDLLHEVRQMAQNSVKVTAAPRTSGSSKSTRKKRA